jgi:hypothetical protein
VLTDPEKEAYREALLGLLADPARCKANLSFLFLAPTEIVGFFHPEPSAERTELMEAWEAAARRVEADGSLSTEERLKACYPLLALAQLEAAAGGDADEPGPLPEELLDHFRDQVAWAAENVTGDGEMQAVMNTMAHVLEDAGLAGELEILLLERMEDSRAPYYFMGWLAGLKAENEEIGEALTWYRKAYDAARGRYTRFRWGSIYLRQVMSLTPEDAATVETASFEILSELLTQEDAFAGGNQMRLGQLDEAYRSWNEDGAHDELLDRIGTLVRDECDRYPGGGEESQQARCEAFLAG